VRWTGKVKQITRVQRSQKKGNTDLVEVTIKSADGRYTLRLRFDPATAPDLALDDVVDVDTGLEVRVRQEEIAWKEGSACAVS